ncbi:MAG: class I adenylate-forming enzyme family protein [Thermoguttaceae bacterium]|jgi:long-chain acyl-CoA synthetase
MKDGCTERPLVFSLLALARSEPDRAALATGEGPLSYSRFAAVVLSAAERLVRRGLGRGERIVIVGTNRPETAVAYFAVHAAGCVAVPLDPTMPPEALRWIVEDAGARLVLLDRDISLGVPCEDLLELVGGNDGGGLGEPACRLDDVADLLYTSGTTGRKKGVVLTHRQIAQAAVNIQAFVQSRPGDVEIMPIPLAHSFGLGRLRAMAVAGNTLVLEPGLRNAAGTLQRLLDLRAAGIAMVPAGFELMVRLTKDALAAAAGHLRYVEIGSAAMRIELKRHLMAMLPKTRICHHYGLTEASRATFLEYHADEPKLDSTGRPSPNVQVAVCDEQGRQVSAGGDGEICVRGGMVMKEYWKQPALTRETLRDGWLRTGDWGRQDADGYLYLAGRQSDLINVGGMKASPEEIEEAINSHPAIVESACLGAPDPQEITGECVKACIVTRSEVSDQQLVQWLRGRIEEYKVPRLWERVDRIARTPSGKIRRQLMRGA